MFSFTGRSVATSRRQDGDQERQDEPTWAKKSRAMRARRCGRGDEGGCGALNELKAVTEE